MWEGAGERGSFLVGCLASQWDWGCCVGGGFEYWGEGFSIVVGGCRAAVFFLFYGL